MALVKFGIRERVLVIALMPSLVLSVIGIGATGYLLRQSEDVKTWSSVLNTSIVQARSMIDTIQQERLLSLKQLSGPRSNNGELAQVRRRLDSLLGQVSTFEAGMANASLDHIDAATKGFASIVARLPEFRQRIDSGSISVGEAYGVYNALVDGVGSGTQIIGKSAPEARVAFEFANSVHALRALEAASRSFALAAVVLNGAELPDLLISEYRNLAGYYRSEVLHLADDLEGVKGADSLVSDPDWLRLVTLEEFIVGASSSEKPAAPPPAQDLVNAWRGDSEVVHDRLLQLWQDQNQFASSAMDDAAQRTSRSSLLAGALILGLAATSLCASFWLANRLTGRLRRLRAETLVLAEEALPATLSTGPAQPIGKELKFGDDEVGAVAAAFNQAHVAAVSATAAENRAREGARAIFLRMAHRSQLIVHRQLRILDAAERQQENPVILETLFELDHLATRERRNAESLVILAGGTPGRRWRHPVPLTDLARSAISEAMDYKRVRIASMPEALVDGRGIADLIHLLAELMDNATHFSPPQSSVEIVGRVVGKGLAIEINDQGIGMAKADLERANELLCHPPDFGVGTQSEELQLGLFIVAQLCVRHGISVRLRESDYGGVRAVVLIPHSLLAAEIDADASSGEHNSIAPVNGAINRELTPSE
ncbi:nitrate- and nitrite sensing domain-containing protein [Nocardia salmonicida]|uniref:sensor histidine kinase n=1 Tax=Nocardia salmonicida TaxID=53431 RepID=UPI0036C618A4